MAGKEIERLALMERYIAFFTQHWILGLLLVVVVLAIMIYEFGAKAVGPKRISAQVAVGLINHEHAMVIDLRDCSSFKQGHIINATNILADELEQKITILTKHRNKQIILVCGGGQQSLRAPKIFARNDFIHVNILNGGMRAWREASLPVEKS